MDSNRPELVSKVFVELLDRGDIDAVLELYEADAVFAELDGVARGRAQIRAALQRFRDAGITLLLEDSLVLEAGDIALVHWSWTVRFRDDSTAAGVSAEVLRRQADGSWKFVIDNSDGSGLLGHF